MYKIKKYMYKIHCLQKNLKQYGGIINNCSNYCGRIIFDTKIKKCCYKCTSTPPNVHTKLCDRMYTINDEYQKYKNTIQSKIILPEKIGEFFKHYDKLFEQCRTRDGYFERSILSFSTIPPEVFIYVTELKLPILEICAGLGFNAFLFELLGCNIIATDIYSDGIDEFTEEDTFTTIIKLDKNNAVCNYGKDENYICFMSWTRFNVDESLFEKTNILPQYILWCGERSENGCTGIISESLLQQYSIMKIWNSPLAEIGGVAESIVLLKKGKQSPATLKQFFKWDNNNRTVFQME